MFCVVQDSYKDYIKIHEFKQEIHIEVIEKNAVDLKGRQIPKVKATAAFNNTEELNLFIAALVNASSFLERRETE